VASIRAAPTTCSSICLRSAGLDGLEDVPVGSIELRHEDAVSTTEKSNAEPTNEQEPIASKVITLEPSLDVGRDAADDVAITGPTARRIPAAAPLPRPSFETSP
jgi:hypothetical protein